MTGPEVAPPLSDGRYRLVSVLGEGGMSTVYAAYDSRLGVHRAVKLLTPALAHHAAVRKRFQAEAKTTARMRHPNIVTVHDVGTDQGRSFIVFELMTGGSLMGRIEAVGPMPPRMACEVMEGVLSALQYAHEQGVIHRDVKPHNILIDADGVPKLTDFGIARVAASSQVLTKTGAAIGTPAYMAPEQRGAANQVDPRADIFGVGATLYALVTGREPFDLYAQELQAQLFADLPEPLSRVIRNATRYNISERYANANTMLAELRAIQDQLPPNPEGTPALNVPLPGRRMGAFGTPNLLGMTPQPLGSNTTVPPDDSEDDDGGGGVELSAFPSLSGLTPRPSDPVAAAAIERSLHDPEDELAIKPGLSRTVFGNSGFWAMIGLAVIAAGGVVAVLLWVFRHEPTASTTDSTRADPIVSAPTVQPPAEVVVTSAPTEVVIASRPAEPTPSSTSSRATPTTATTSAASTASTSSARSTPRSSTGAGTRASAPVESRAPGTLVITTAHPSRARVFLNAVDSGTTRFRQDVAPGVWKVNLETNDGVSHVTSLVVTSGQETTYCWDFRDSKICD